MRYCTQSALILLFLSAILAGCGQSAQENSASHQPPPTKVGFITVHEQPFTLTNELSGRTSPYQIAEVRPQITGIINARLFEEGATVEAGQALYQIDDSLYQAALASARADLENAQATVESASLTATRYERLIKTGAVSQQTLDEARATLNAGKARVAAARASLKTAEINLNYTRIKAPISGRIGRSAMTEGALVTANQGTALATIRQLDPIYVDLTQSYDELQQLRTALANGQLQTLGENEAKVRLQQRDGTPYAHSGMLQFSEYAVDETTGSVTLRAVFPNPDEALLPGMFVRAQLPQAEQKNAVLVPQKAIAREPGGKASAFVINGDNTVQKRAVTINKAVGNQWLLHEGLKEGDHLVIDGLQKIRDGVAVTPVNLGENVATTNNTAETPDRG